MKRFKQILCVIDPQQPADTVVSRAVSLARNNQATLTVVCVAPLVSAGIGMPEGGPISKDLQDAIVSEIQRQMDNVLSPFRSQFTFHSKVLIGTAFLEIIREVLRNRHDLVIKAPETPGWLERLFGSDDMHLLRKCPCPIWFVKHAPTDKYQRILAAVDIDEDHPAAELPVRHGLNVQILELAVSLALADFAELHVAHVWDAIGEKAMRGTFLSVSDKEVDAYVEQVQLRHKTGLDNLLKEVIDTAGADALQFLNPQRHIVKGRPRVEIPAKVKDLDVDLIIMGTVARTGIPGFFIGNTAEAILEQIGCSVLALKPNGFKTPVSLQADFA